MRQFFQIQFELLSRISPFSTVRRQPLAACLKCIIPSIVSFLFMAAGSACAQSVQKISDPVWAGLSQAEKDVIQKSYLVESMATSSFGTIIDNQSVNESTPGTTGGTVLGQAVANASYIDTALRGGNYSAKTQLGAILLGSILGSTLDSKGTSRFHQRYAVRMGDGNIQYFDEISSNPFRHPVGVCVTVPNVAIAEDQQLCSQNVAMLRVKFLGQPMPTQSMSTPSSPSLQSTSNVVTALPVVPVATDSTGLINCKLNSLAPVRTTAEKCNFINGKSVQ